MKTFILTVVLLLTISCTKQEVTPQKQAIKVYTSAIGDWNYKDSSFTIKFTVIDSTVQLPNLLVTQWAKNCYLTYNNKTFKSKNVLPLTANDLIFNISNSSAVGLYTYSVNTDYTQLSVNQMIIGYSDYISSGANQSTLNNISFTR